jgi:hypothetical protein
MNLRLTLLKRTAPRFLKARLLDELTGATAAGFGSARPRWTGRSFETRLREYARFTADEAGRVLSANDPLAAEAVKDRLRRQATELGARVRGGLRLRRPAEAVGALAVLYGHLGMDMSAGDEGEIVVRRCLFSDYFTEQVCTMVAALDEGMAAGLSGGGKLEFVERITGGAACCRARISFGGPGP